MDAADTQQQDGILAEGSRFGVYVIGPCIGRGGMARVYRAEHEGLRRQVALKTLTLGFERDASGRERFLREARIAASIRHPNVVSIFDVGLHEDVPFLVMELLEGEDLESVLATRGAMDAETLIDIAVPVIAGLSAVHDAGVVHRDLKPANIFLAHGAHGEIEPKLLDFGISRSSWAEHTRLTVGDGVLMGTPCYLSPEAISGGEMTALSDQYSLGVLMYECATGVNPFQAGSVVEVLGLIKAGAHTPASRLAPDLPKRLVQIIERAKSVDPRRRYPDLRQLGRELLVLAGNRTRVTWALSFGVDLEKAAAAGQGVTAALALPPAAPGAAHGPASPASSGALQHGGRSRPAVAAAAAIALSILVAVTFRPSSERGALSALDTRQGTAALQAGSPPARGEEAPGPAGRAQALSVEQPPANVALQTAESASAEPQRAVPGEAGNERAARSAAPRIKARPTPRPRASSPRALATRHSAPPALMPASLEPVAADELLWSPAIAGSESQADPGSSPATGTNQAPIFE